MNNISENTFAAACYDQNNIKELEAALIAPADATDMTTWNLTEAEYFANVKLALDAKRAEIVTYTVTSSEGEYPRHGLTLAQAADEILSSDSREWKIRFDNGVWEIWSRQQVANIGWGKTTIVSWADTKEAAENELFLEVIENSYDWRGHDIALTDADYFESVTAA